MKEKYSLVIASGFIQFASWFCFDFPGSINKNYESYIGMNAEKASLYSYIAYSFPTIITSLFFGYFISVSKARIVSILCLLIALGNCIFLLGFFYHSFGLIIIGRIIAGLGGESFTINQNKKIVNRFKDSELAFAISLFNIIGKLGTLSNFLVTPWIIQKFSTLHAISLGVLITFGALLIGMFLDNKDSIQEISNVMAEENNFDLELEEKIGTPQKYKESIQQNTLFYENLPLSNEQTAWNQEKSTYPLDIHRKLEIEEIREIKVEDDVLIVTPGIKASEKIHHVFYIYLSMILFFTFSWAPFYNISSFLFQNKYSFDNVKACKVIAYIETASLFFYSLISYFSDHFGYKMFIINCGMIFLLMGHLFIFFKGVSLIISGLFISIGFSFFNCHWPCIPLLINNKKIGIGYASAVSVINLGYVLSPLILASFIERDMNYNLSYFYIILLTILTLFISVIMAHLNRKYEIGMNEPEKKKTFK